jgi:hypothetical protein
MQRNRRGLRSAAKMRHTEDLIRQAHTYSTRRAKGNKRPSRPNPFVVDIGSRVGASIDFVFSWSEKNSDR